jgi:hypothetical protein
MPFKKLTINKYPPRLWALVGFPGGGKSTFATQMRTPILPIDADLRFAEVASLATGDVFQLSDNAADNTDPTRIAELLDANMRGAGVATIVVDSLTAIITPLVTKAIVDNDAGVNKNKVASFKAKAMAMRQLQDAISRWGSDVLWVYHLQDSRDNKAQAVTRATLPATERSRLYRSLNLELHIVRDGERRGIKVVWARQGRSDVTLWDDSGTWSGMPERIEQAVYDGLSDDDQAAIESTPAAFPNAEAAIAFGFEQGAFDALQHARNAYHKLKEEKKPGQAAEMWALWISDVERRIAELSEPVSEFEF